MSINFCNHHFVDGFGGIGDSLVCIHCGLDKYPEAIPIQVMIAKMQGRIVKETDEQYNTMFMRAEKARLNRSYK